ncbi:phosphonate metabolism transcriptional regulator PhnF [Maritalea sp.]|uniref:phosphonate metabolism transcriptional regulator PhnF n=1 Tax=Maritalea sp. TaxID=2003361 RepID=UPI003EF17999
MSGVKEIERGRGVSLWRQIAERLQSDVAAAVYPAGSQLPTELELAQKYGVNRHTVRRAIGSLSETGILSATRGRGTFVAERTISYPISSRTRFSEIVSSNKRQPGGRLISSGEEAASAEVAQRLSIEEGVLVTRGETLRVADGRPITVGTYWINKKLIPNFIADYAELGSVSEVFERAGFSEYRRQKSWVAAIPASAHDAALMQVPVGDPLLEVYSVNVSESGQPLQYTRARFRGDVVQLEVEN